VVALAGDLCAWQRFSERLQPDQYGRGRTLCPEGNLKIVRLVSRQVLTPRLPVRHRHLKRYAVRGEPFPGCERPVQTASKTMTDYPVIDRRDGRLFFSLDVTDRVSIATSVERLIDLLDAYEGDCDIEDNGDEFDVSYPEGGRRLAASYLEDDEDGGDSEPVLGSPNDYNCGSQVRWGRIWGADECEEENEHGGDVQDEPHGERDDDEPELGWTETVNQEDAAIVSGEYWFAQDGEPLLGWPNAGQRATIEMAADGDRELDNSDWEPSLGAPERHPLPSGFTFGDDPARHTQARWSDGVGDEREDDGDDLEPDNDAEYSLGWTFHVDQTKAIAGGCNMDGGEGEPDLGWSGHGIGWRDGDDPRALEAGQLGDDELELDDADGGPCLLSSPKSIRANRSLGVDPALLPDQFNCACEGDCLEPVVANGARLHFDKRLPVQFDQLVMIVRKPGMYPKGEHQAVVKRLIADLRGTPWLGWPEGGVIAEMLNPHQVLFYPTHTISMLIACTGPAADPIGPRLTAGDLLVRRAEVLVERRQVC